MGMAAGGLRIGSVHAILLGYGRSQNAMKTDKVNIVASSWVL